MAEKKSVSIRELKETANRLLASHIDKELKKGICLFLEDTLNEANAYKGFDHLYWKTEGRDKWIAEGRPLTSFGKVPQQYIGDEFDRIYF